MIFHSEQWIFWAIIAVGLLAYSLLFDALLSRDIGSATSKTDDALTRTQLIDACLAALPLLGLLGTIMGLLQTFTDMSRDHVDANALVAGGVGTALGSTQLGLLFAVPGYLLNHFYKSRLQDRLQANTVSARDS